MTGETDRDREVRRHRGAGPRPDLVSLAEIRKAARLLAPVVVRTPLVPFPGLGRELLVKPESLQPTGSFKLRGAYVAISAGGQDARERGVIAHSSGNHGHAVAYAASLLGVRAVVVVPRTAPKVKTDAIEYYGAQLVTVEPTLAARVAATEELMARYGYLLIPPFDDRRVIAGQGTIGLEIAADCPRADPASGCRPGRRRGTHARARTANTRSWSARGLPRPRTSCAMRSATHLMIWTARRVAGNPTRRSSACFTISASRISPAISTASPAASGARSFSRTRLPRSRRVSVRRWWTC